MDKRVPQPASRQIRPALKALDGRSFPEIGRAPTARSDMPLRTRAAEGVFHRSRGLRMPSGSVEAQRSRDPRAQLRGHLFAAALRYHDAQLRFEIVGLEARGAGVEVALDELPTLRRELSVEVEVELMCGVVAVAATHS